MEDLTERTGPAPSRRRPSSPPGRFTLLQGGGLLLLCAAAAQNLGNLVFHAVASHVVGPAAYGALGSILTLTVAFTIPLGALQVAITRGIAETGPGVDPRRTLARVLRAAAVAAALVALAAPFVRDFLHLDSIGLPLLLAPYTFLAAAAAAGRGAAIGRERLAPAAASILAATVARLVIGVFAVVWWGALGAVLATIAAEAIGAAVALRAAVGDRRGAKPVDLGMEQLVETSAVTAGIWMLGSVDVLLARHFLDAGPAGFYVAAGTATRAVLVLPQALLMIAMPRFVELVAAGRRGARAAWTALCRTAVLALALTAVGAIAVGALGPSMLEHAFGFSRPIDGLTLWLLALGTLPAALASVHATYELARHSRLALLPWVGAAAELIAIAAWHSSTSEIAAAALAGVGFQAALIAALIIREGRASRGAAPVVADPSAHADGRLRVLVLSWRDGAHPAAGGAEVYVEQVARRWARQGHSVTIFCAAVAGRPEREQVDGLTYVRRGSRVGVYRAARRYWHAEGHGAFDLVVDVVNTRPFDAPRFVREVPVVALAFQVCREIWFYEAPLPVALAGRLVLERWWLRRYRDVPTLTISESSRRSLERYGLRDLHVVPVGLDLPAAPVVPKRAEPTLVVCGRLVRSKRFDDAIDAFARLQRTMPDARLVVIGTGPDERRLRARAPQGVEFVGRVDEAEKLRLMAEAHVLLATSVREGWGLIVSEAAAVGTPTVAYDVPGLRDSVAAGHGRVSAPDPAALAAVLVDALPGWMANPPDRIAHGGAQGWDAVAESVLTTALEACGEPADHPTAPSPVGEARPVAIAGAPLS